MPEAKAIYYGHTHPTVPEQTVVKKGDVIAKTSSPGGGGAPNRWLEIGAWINGPTGNGQWMHDQLIVAPIFGAGNEGDKDLKNLIILVPESGTGATWLWNTAVDIRYGIADAATAANLQAAGVPRIVMADADINEIPHR